MGKWEDLKEKGSELYKTKDIEPIDLLRSGEMLQNFALGCIIKYAFRNREACTGGYVSVPDMEKIIHYAEMLITAEEG